MPHLFDRFHRVPGATSRTHEGSGIGLALVSELVALHGGTIEAESVHGEGTTFTVRIPLGAAHLPPDQVSEAHHEHDAQRRAQAFVDETTRWRDTPAPDLGQDDVVSVAEARRVDGVEQARPSVLVVDDNPDMREYIETLLRRALRRGDSRGRARGAGPDQRPPARPGAERRDDAPPRRLRSARAAARRSGDHAHPGDHAVGPRR